MFFLLFNKWHAKSQRDFSSSLKKSSPSLSSVPFKRAAMRSLCSYRTFLRKRV